MQEDEESMPMKRLAVLLVLYAAALPALAAAPITLAELKARLAEMHDQYKDDGTVADWIRTVALREPLPGAVRREIEQYAPGPVSTGELEILEGRTAFLPADSASLPADPAPDAAAQQALLAKAAGVLAASYGQLQHFTASKTLDRFQDQPRNTNDKPSLTLDAGNPFQKQMETRVETVQFDKGAEKPSTIKAKVKWGANGFVSEGDPAPALSLLFAEAQASGTLAFKRWETVGTARAAVFAFAVDKKKTRFTMNYCCFSSTSSTSNVAAPHSEAGSLSVGDIQDVSTQRPFKKQTGYRGEFYIDAASGGVLRMILEPELKPSDFVHMEATRIDFAAQKIGGVECMLPETAFVLNELVLNDNILVAAYNVRHSLFIARYSDYKAN
jgi:hypothetical protein